MSSRRRARAMAASARDDTGLPPAEAPVWARRFERERWWDNDEQPPTEELARWEELARLDPHQPIDGSLELWRWCRAMRRWQDAGLAWCADHGLDYRRAVLGRPSASKEPLTLPPRATGPLIFPRWMLVVGDDADWGPKRSAQYRWLVGRGVDPRDWLGQWLPIQRASFKAYGLKHPD